MQDLFRPVRKACACLVLLLITAIGWSQVENDAEELIWNSNWIWYPGARDKVDFHFYARKEFTIDKGADSAIIHISAYSDYQLFINGNFVGRGPNSNYPKFLYYDSYNVTNLLKTGRNLIAIHVHNYAVGLHWIPDGPGGLISQLELKDGTEHKRIVTDKSWKIKKAEAYSNTPVRMQWSAKFTETFDFNRFSDGWHIPGFDDKDWIPPVVIGKHPVYPWESLIKRRIPYFDEVLQEPISFVKSKFSVNGFHAVGFSDIIHEGENKIGFAEAYFFIDKSEEITMEISSDDAFKFFINDSLKIHQNYNEDFVTSQTWNKREDFNQFHYAQSPRTERVKISLKKGWNRFFIAVDQGPGGWGFVLGILDKGPQFYKCVKFSSDTLTIDSRWSILGPIESSGLKNSLDNICSSLILRKALLLDPFDYTRVTDYSKLMRCETRTGSSKSFNKGPFILEKGENFIIDLEVVKFGHPVLEITSEGQSIIDIGYSNALMPDRRIGFIPQVRYVDRLILKGGTQMWENFTKRECRYIYISLRKGNKVEFSKVKMKSIFYPVKNAGTFSSSDTLMNRIWAVSKYTTHLLMQDNWQDCLKREEGAHNTRSFNHQFMGGMNTFGDSRLTRKNILDGIQSQDENGWFSSHGSTDNSADEPTQMLWWFDLVKNYYMYTGDTLLVGTIYDRMKGVLRYFSRIENKNMLLDCRNDFLYTISKIIYIDDWNGYYFGASDKTYLGYNLLYFGALKNMAYLSEQLGETEDAVLFNRKAEVLRKAFKTFFWDDDKKSFSDWIKDDERGPATGSAVQSVGLYFNAFDSAATRLGLNFMCDSLGGSHGEFENYQFTFGFYYYFLEMLFNNGKQEMAHALMKAYYGRWLELGATTMGEHFQLSYVKGKKQLDYEYNTHGYSTSALEHFYSNILGIRPIEAGYKKVLIRPQPGSLEWARGTAFTPEGNISVDWHMQNNRMLLNVNGPESYDYIIAPSQEFEVSASVNGIKR